MIDLHYWTTANGHKITIFLEETGLPYRIVPVNIGKGQQFEPDFLRLSPNNRIPAILDHAPADGGAAVPVFESGAILLYLADKTQQLIATDLRGRNDTVQWLFWQMAGLGPMAGQNGHFNHAAPEKIPYAIDRYVRETSRLYAVLDKQLQGRDYITGSYSIADIASYPWVANHARQQQKIDDFPNLQRWLERIGQRDAVQRAYAIAKEVNPPGAPAHDAASRQLLYGQDASTVRR